jgi:hypothetical protein
MKLSTSFILLVFSFLSSGATAAKFLSSGATAANVIRYLFNNGVDQLGLVCNATDWTKINPIFNITYTGRRNLRQVNIVNKDRTLDFEMDIIGQHNIEERALQKTPAQCREDCKGYANRCRASGCDWYIVRRNLGGEMSARELQTAWCTSTAGLINTQLDNLVSTKKVSAPCQLLLSAPRMIECWDDIIYGVVEHFNIWNADTDVMIKKDARDGFSVCASIRINVEARTNPCVVSAKTVLTGPNGYYANNTDVKVPYSVFGNTGAKVYNFNGNFLAPGNYTITAIPDGDSTKTKQMTFTVANC